MGIAGSASEKAELIKFQTLAQVEQQRRGGFAGAEEEDEEAVKYELGGCWWGAT
jgi:hypothetical protein